MSAQKAQFALIRECMPKVTDIVAGQRRELGAEYVKHCQQRGMAGEPGWFYAWENGLAIGTPWPEILHDLAVIDPRNEFADKAVVFFRPKGENDGSH